MTACVCIKPVMQTEEIWENFMYINYKMYPFSISFINKLKLRQCRNHNV